MSELTLDHSKRIRHLGSYTGLELPHLLRYRSPRCVLLLPALARAHRNMPLHASCLPSFAGTFVTRVAEDNDLLTVPQSVSLGDIAGVGSRSDDGLHQTRICVNSDVRLHPEVPLVAFLDLVHLGVTPTGTDFGGAGGCDQSGIDHGANIKQQVLGGQGGIDSAQQLQAKVVFFEQVAKPQVGGFVGQSGDAGI